MSKSPFHERVVVVTGGASGIGRSIAECFDAEGAKVSILDCCLRGAPDSVGSYECDVRFDDQVERAIRAIGEGHGRIDILVNNAGVSYPATVEEGPLSDWKNVIDVNVLGYVRATRAALPYLRLAEHAAIINISSCTATTGLRRRVVYSATKGAIEAMSRAMAADLVHEGVRVNCVAPGTVDMPLIRELIGKSRNPEAQRQVYNDRQPTGFMLTADEVARAVLYLADPRSRSTVGSVLTVDGGMSSMRLYSS